MLSICIPTYRYDVRLLVAELLRQVDSVDAVIEILVYDDASPKGEDWGRADLRQTAGICYVELETNLGRAAIRNKLAQEASHGYVVMMDADGWPNPNFLKHYLRASATETFPAIIVGGRTYATDPPKAPKLLFHWWYGTKRESRTPEQIRQDGWLGFQSNNFLTTRDLLLTHPFLENHQGYGHEDTLWGQQFTGTGINICPGDNPVIHLGLEPSDVFLRKQRQAIANLRLLKNQSPHLRTRLIDLAEKFPFLPTLASFIPERIIVSYLTNRARPYLYALDLLKLRWWKEGENRN